MLLAARPADQCPGGVFSDGAFVPMAASLSFVVNGSRPGERTAAFNTFSTAGVVACRQADARSYAGQAAFFWGLAGGWAMGKRGLAQATWRWFDRRASTATIKPHRVTQTGTETAACRRRSRLFLPRPPPSARGPLAVGSTRPRRGESVRWGWQEVTKGDTEIVSVLRGALVEEVGRPRYDFWFGAGTRLEIDGTRLIVSAPTPFFQDWLRANFRQSLELAGAKALGVRPEVVFRVESPAEEGPGSPPADTSGPEDSTPLPAATGRVGEPPLPPAAQASPPGLESFVAGRRNHTARKTAEMILQRPGALSPVLFYGPTSVGKTHLLRALCSSFRRQRPRSACLYLTAEQFTTGFLQALRGTGTPNFRQKCRGVEMLALDDLQFFCGKRATLIELLNTIDHLMREGRQLVFAADRPPAELAELGTELRTRLESGMVCELQAADYEMRVEIVGQMACRMGLEVPDEVRHFIAARLTNHARELSGALCRLQAASVASGRSIDRALAEETLADMIRHSQRLVRLQDIEKAVCHAFGVEAESLRSPSKSKSASQPRMLAMWLARKHTRAALSEIGRYFGRRSHSTGRRRSCRAAGRGGER